MADIIRNKRVRPEMTSEPATSGWGELHRHVRTTDINKVDDCRDDIDTLLVFAGLYSAVLTAFVIESYTHLQQDTQDVIVGLLQQLVAKNFTSGPGYMNSTNPSPQLPPFEPPIWAIRVNVLWFTSLLLSLASASFGILVKQWLREYLAIDYAAPRERLRARQYRYPAMEDWKVFEIAAFLPLLLQLSLGLFFIGLCFFTSAVHQSIGRTTAPLVCAWVFLLFMMTIAPLFSPRCPFKTTFLKKALKVGRRYTAPLFYDLTKSTLGLAQRISRISHTASVQISQYLQPNRNYLTHVTHAASRRWTRLTEFARARNVRLGRRSLVASEEGVDRSVRRREYIATKKAALLEENEVVKGEEEDGEVLLLIDSLMFDDGLLLPMLDALRQQSGTTPRTIVTFILQIIGRRIGQDLCEKPRLTYTPDLNILPRNVWTILTDGLVDGLLLRQSGPLELQSETNSDFLFNVITILHSSSHHRLSEHASKTLQELIVVPRRTSAHHCPGGVQPYRYLSHDRNTTSLQASPDPEIKDSTPCLRCIMDVYITMLGRSSFSCSLRRLLDNCISDDSKSFIASSKGLLQDLVDILVPFLLGTISSQKDPAEIPGSNEALHIILQYGEKFGRRDDTVKLCRQMLLTESCTRMLLVEFVALHPQCRVSEDIQGILGYSLGSFSSEDDTRIRSHFTAACERFCNGGDDGDDDVPLDYVRLCAAFIPWMRDGQTDRAVAMAIEKYHQTQGWQKTLQRREYWYSDAESPTSEELFKEDRALACRVLESVRTRSTELINALWLFVPEERSDEILRSIRKWGIDYTPPTLPAPSTALEESENGQGGTAKGGQEAGDVGSEGPVGTGQDVGRGEAVDVEASGSADVSTVEVPSGAERTEDQDAAGHEVGEEGIAGDGEDVAGGGGA